MTEQTRVQDDLRTAGVIGVLPADYPRRQRTDIIEIVDALLAAPLPALAVTTDHPDAPHVIRECRRRSGPHMLVGIATAAPRWRFPAEADFALGPQPPNVFVSLYVPWRSGVARLPNSDGVLRLLPALAGAVAGGSGPSHRWRPHATRAGWLVGPALFPEPYAGMADLIRRARRLRLASGYEK